MIPNLALNDGNAFPILGLGLMAIADDAVPAVMRQAAELGYRAFDTAPIYRNERGTGLGLRECGLPRDQLRVTTKLWNTEHGFDTALRAFDQSLAALGLDYVDAYLIHWPVPARGLYLETWRALVRLRDEGRIKSIGVSNFLPEQLARIIGETGVAPALNQVELHPEWQQTALRDIHAAHGIVTQAWSPLGRGSALQDPRIAAIAERLACSAAQVILAYFAHEGVVTIPKASSPQHLAENIAGVSIRLDDQAIAAMRALDRADGRFGPDPMVFETIPGRA